MQGQRARRDRAPHRPGWLAVAVGAAIILQPGHTQASEAVAIDKSLPREELFDRQLIAIARFFEADRAGAHRGHDFGFAADYPSLRVGRRQLAKTRREGLLAAVLQVALPTLSSLRSVQHNRHSSRRRFNNA